MKSLSLRLVVATTLVFIASFAGTFAVLVRETQYGLFRVQQNSLTVQVDMLTDRLSIAEGEPTLDLGSLAGGLGEPLSYALLDRGGRVLRSYGLDGIAVSPETLKRFDQDQPFGFSLERWLDLGSGDAVTLILPDAEGRQRIVVSGPADNGLIVQASMLLLNNNIGIQDILYTFTEATALALLVPLVLAMIAIPIIVRLTLKPIRRVSRQAAAMDAATLDRRLSLHRVPPEMRDLVVAFNDLLGRLDSAWRLQREFTANAAHELRTPIAALRAEVEAMVPPTGRSLLATQFDKVGRLLTQLLVLAEADSRPIDTSSQFDPMTVARDTVSDLAPNVIAAGKNISIERSAAKPVLACGDHAMAEIALRNLVDNALRHSTPGSEIRVSVDGPCIRVANTGSQIPPDAQNAMFERFWKHDRRASGSGLGLSIVATIMKRLGGTVDVACESGVVVFAICFRPAGDA